MDTSKMQQSNLSQSAYMNGGRSLDRLAKIKDNEDKMTTIHAGKSERSNPFFKDAKVTTCSQVLVKNG